MRWNGVKILNTQDGSLNILGHYFDGKFGRAGWTSALLCMSFYQDLVKRCMPHCTYKSVPLPLHFDKNEFFLSLQFFLNLSCSFIEF